MDIIEILTKVTMAIGIRCYYVDYLIFSVIYQQYYN